MKWPCKRASHKGWWTLLNIQVQLHSAQHFLSKLKSKVQNGSDLSYVQNASTVSNVKVHNSAAPTVQLIDRVELNHSFRRALCSSLRCPILSLLQEISRLEEVLHLRSWTFENFGDLWIEDKNGGSRDSSQTLLEKDSLLSSVKNTTLALKLKVSGHMRSQHVPTHQYKYASCVSTSFRVWCSIHESQATEKHTTTHWNYYKLTYYDILRHHPLWNWIAAAGFFASVEQAQHKTKKT